MVSNGPVELHTYPQMLRVLKSLGLLSQFGTYEDVLARATQEARGQGITTFFLVVDVRFQSNVKWEWGLVPAKLTRTNWQQYQEFSQREGQEDVQMPNVYLADASKYHVPD